MKESELEEDGSSFADFMNFSENSENGMTLLNGFGFGSDWASRNLALAQTILFLSSIGFKSEHKWTNSKAFDPFSDPPSVSFKGLLLETQGPPKNQKESRAIEQCCFVFLEAIQELFEEYKRNIKSKSFLEGHKDLPAKIDLGKKEIGGLSVSLANEEQWSQAMNGVLGNLKFLMGMERQRCQENNEDF